MTPQDIDKLLDSIHKDLQHCARNDGRVCVDCDIADAFVSSARFRNMHAIAMKRLSDGESTAVLGQIYSIALILGMRIAAKKQENAIGNPSTTAIN